MKSLNTLKFLMKKIEQDYQFERVTLRYSESNIDTVIKLLVRVSKMYEVIDDMITIF